MKNKKKHKKSVPDVHIQGDLEDVKKLVDIVSKKKSVVIFRNGSDGTCYADIEKIMVEYSETDITRLKKDFRIIYFDFFPGNKPVKVEPVIKSVTKPVTKPRTKPRTKPAAILPVTPKKRIVKAKAIIKANPVKPNPGNKTSKEKK